MKTDYRSTHQSREASRVYDEVLYHAGTYDDVLWQEEKKILTHEIKKLKRDIAHISYLDFGCGTGRIMSHLENFVDESTGVDIAAEMLERARGVVKRAILIQADITRGDVLAGKKFDVITAFRFFLNAEQSLRNEVMALLAEKLRDENSILIFNIHGNLWSHRIITKMWLRMHGKHLSVATQHEMAMFAQHHGLSLVRWYGFGVLPKILYRVLGAPFAHRLDFLLSHMPGSKYISYDLIFVCKKK